MTTFAHHDAKGNVRALVTANGRKTVMLTPKPGEFVTQIDPGKMDLEKLDVAAIRKMAKGMKIPVPKASGSKGK